MGKTTKYNATCPSCGVEGKLVGEVCVGGIPLSPDGFNDIEGQSNGLEDVLCTACETPDLLDHYLYHGKECDCEDDLL